jgi:hypothetical protein
MTIEELYKQKGELITNIELFQMQLKKVNNEIFKQLNLIKKEKDGDSIST